MADSYVAVGTVKVGGRYFRPGAEVECSAKVRKELLSRGAIRLADETDDELVEEEMGPDADPTGDQGEDAGGSDGAGSAEGEDADGS